jgi:WD40 repeat protein
VRRVLSGHHDGTISLEWSPDGDRIATVSETSSAYIWNAFTGAQLASVRPGSEGVRLVAWSPGAGEQLAVGTDSVWLSDGRSGKEKRRIVQEESLLTALAWSPDGKWVATANGDFAVRIRRADGSGEQVVHKRHTAAVRTLVWSPDSNLLASAGNDRRVCLWRMDRKQVHVWPVQPDVIHSLAFAPDSRTLAGGGADRRVYVWDMAAGARKHSLSGQEGTITALTWGGNDRVLSLGEDAVLRTWDAGEGKAAGAVRMQAKDGRFSPDGKLVASGGLAYTLRLSETATGQTQGTMTLLQSGTVLISPEGHYRVSKPEVERDLVYVVETSSGQETLTPEEFNRRFGWRNDPQRVRFNFAGQ